MARKLRRNVGTFSGCTQSLSARIDEFLAICSEECRIKRCDARERYSGALGWVAPCCILKLIKHAVFLKVIATTRYFMAVSSSTRPSASPKCTYLCLIQQIEACFVSLSVKSREKSQEELKDYRFWVSGYEIIGTHHINIHRRTIGQHLWGGKGRNVTNHTIGLS